MLRAKKFVERFALIDVGRTVLEYVPTTCDDAQASTTIGNLIDCNTNLPKATEQLEQVPRHNTGSNKSDAELKTEAALMTGSEKSRAQAHALGTQGPQAAQQGVTGPLAASPRPRCLGWG
jgi:hypothetical protein